MAGPPALRRRRLRALSDQNDAQRAAHLRGDLQAAALEQIRPERHLQDDQFRALAAQSFFARPQCLGPTGGLDQDEAVRAGKGLAALRAQGTGVARLADPQDFTLRLTGEGQRECCTAGSHGLVDAAALEIRCRPNRDRVQPIAPRRTIAELFQCGSVNLL